MMGQVMVELKQRLSFSVVVLDITMQPVANTSTLLAIDRTEPEKKIRFAEQKIRFDGSTPSLTRTFPKIELKFGLQNLPSLTFNSSGNTAKQYKCKMNTKQNKWEYSKTIQMQNEYKTKQMGIQQNNMTGFMV